MNRRKKLKDKVITLLQFLRFSRLHPEVLIVGAPRLVRLLHANCRSKSSTFYSQSGQDHFIVSEFFQKILSENFPKTILDIGANHPVQFNNSYFFERHLGFQAYAVDAVTKHNESWRSVRPDAVLVNTAVSSEDFGEVIFEEFSGNGIEDMYSAVVNSSAKTIGKAHTIRSLRTRTLSSLLTQWEISRVGILSLDIEGFELEALRGLDFDKASVAILIVENNNLGVVGDERIRSYLQQYGYVFYARFWGLDDIFVDSKILSRDDRSNVSVNS